MRKVRVGGTSQNFTTQLFEFIRSIRKSADFGWADKSEVKWVEEKNDVFSFELRHREVFDEISVDDGGSGEVRGLSADFSVSG